MLVHQQPAILPAPAVANPGSAPRKRRRRAPTTGAAEDCFTCRANGTKCDRRRPYCGPCLDVGDECKGYRTQLTWGVGVASRGKLRGMTLPVSIESNISVAERDRRCAVKKKSIDETAEKARRLRNSLEAMNRMVDGDRKSISGDIAKLSIITNYDFVNMEHPLTSNTVNSAIPKIDHGSAKSPTSMETVYTTSIANTPLMMQPAYSPAAQHTQQRPEYTSDMLNFHKTPYSSNSVPSHTPSGLVAAPEFPEYDRMYTSHNEGSYSLSPSPSISPLYDGSLIASSAYLPATTITVSSSMPSYAPLVAPTHSEQQFLDAHHIHPPRNQQWGHIAAGSLHKQTTVGGNLSDLLYDDEMLAHPDSEFTFTVSPYSTSVSKVSISQSGQYFNHYHATVPPISAVAQISMELQSPQLASLSTELKFLIDYYDKTVCPSIVAFDGPSNPYRTHILRLAFQNDALMQAICALSCSHLQQKKRLPFLESRRSSPPRFSSRSSSQSPRNSTSPPPRTSATSYHNSSDIISASKLHNLDSSALSHKNASIKLLNSQLTDGSLAITDSAMATLLILCLYHICETGIGQFKTHLAGVKKLMGMRGVGKETGRWGWMETVFTWFDNISASVNNREAQLRGGYLDMIAETNDDWDLESLTGCNRHLFMRLAGLGRINMLSQQAPTNFYKPGPYRQMEDDDSEPVRNENDGRDEFWASWNAMKNDLLAWKPCAKYAATPSRHRAPEFDYTSVDFDFSSQTHSPASSNSTLHPMSPSSPPRKASKAYEAVERNHWIHSSNVWRYAAILYLDRLAYPHLSSSHHVFQNTVRIVLDHLNCIPTTSGLSKSLMWPLFITGTECVVDDHRMLIRERCFDMQRDCGFFNKVSGLDVLETLWDMEIDEDGYYEPSRYLQPGSETIGGRGLRWRRVTQQEDGEYLMI